jgi:membrane protein DedA with SNARE-associated domain
VTHLLLTYGLVLLFVLLAMESAGVPVPGETALITAALFSTSQKHHFSIVWVIVVASAAAIVGDNIGYWIGRLGGRRLVERWGPLERHARRVLPPAERFFEKHGAKTVFIGRWIAVLRVTAAWLAGVTKMPWWKFLLWNAAGGIAWATAIGLIAYYAGKAAADAIGRYGLYGAGALAVLGALAGGAVYLWHRRTEAKR